MIDATLQGCILLLAVAGWHLSTARFGALRSQPARSPMAWSVPCPQASGGGRRDLRRHWVLAAGLRRWVVQLQDQGQVVSRVRRMDNRRPECPREDGRPPMTDE